MSPEPPAGTTDYDVAVIHFDAVAVQSAANTLKAESAHVLASLQAVVGALDDLALGWAGATAAEAQEFGARWVAVATQLFGGAAAVTDDTLTAEDGVLNVLTSGLDAIVAGFSDSESYLKKLLDDFKAELGVQHDMTYATPATVGADIWTAVDESWP